MKVLIKYSGRTETVENVSVDDKCFPVVAGLHPYPSTTGDISPLVTESALWFKTLAVEAVYIDCDRRWIYWVPAISNMSSGDVLMRRSSKEATDSSSFIPVSAKPLFKDSSVYDFDASLKEMMTKCTEAARKLFKKFQSDHEFNKILAKILHLYILPSINFTDGDLSSLKRAQCLIELRLEKSEAEIASKANSIANLRLCLDTLKKNLLSVENLDSERYLRTCQKEFLVAFLKTIETNVNDLNNDLSSEQSKVNWAKQHLEDSHKIFELQGKRDSLFGEIDKLIMVREAIKNVLCRRDLTRKKQQKCVAVNSCFHNIFVEIVRRLELEDRVLSKLGNDKVNICAAREAIVCTILEMVNNNRNSDRATKFEPEDFANYSVEKDQNAEKSPVWLTFQERVARVLRDVSSKASRLHKGGCWGLTLKINAALSEYYLTKQKTLNRAQRLHEPATAGSFDSSLNVTAVTLRNSKTGNEHLRKRNAVLMERKYESCSVSKPHPEIKTAHSQFLRSPKVSDDAGTNPDFFHRKALSTNNIHLRLSENNLQKANVGFDEDSGEPLRRNVSTSSFVLVDDHFASVNEELDGGSLGDDCSQEVRLTRQRNIVTAQLALGALMSMVDGLKFQIGSHFSEVIGHLCEEITWEETNEVVKLEQQELLWKSYDRFFCEEVLEHLMKLYVTGLSPSIRKAYVTLRKTSLEEVLKEDRLLDLFFGDTGNDRASFMPPSDGSEDMFSLTKTVSDMSLDVRCFDVKHLYALANTDAVNMQQRFSFDTLKFEEDGAPTSSSDSLKSSDLSSDDETFYTVKSTSSTSAISVPSSDSLNTRGFNESDRRNTLSDMDKVGKVLDPVLSPFRKLVQKCLDATCFLDKIRYIMKATEGLNRDISEMISPDFQSACDDIISMVVLALYNLPEEMFVGLYVNLRMILDVRPGFLEGTLSDYNLVTLFASYDYLFTLKACELVVRDYPGSFRARR